VADNPNTPSAPKAPEKQAVEKQVVEKLPIKEQIKDFKEVKDKPEKFEVKEKPEKFEVKEKPEKFEVKEKPEKIEHKEKPEKHEFKEKEVKVEQLEKSVLEQLPTNPGGPVEQPGTNPGQASSHFIAPDQRPDVSRGALAGETKK
jgi:hypothetical protein